MREEHITWARSLIHSYDQAADEFADYVRMEEEEGHSIPSRAYEDRDDAMVSIADEAIALLAQLIGVES